MAAPPFNAIFQNKKPGQGQLQGQQRPMQQGQPQMNQQQQVRQVPGLQRNMPPADRNRGRAVQISDVSQDVMSEHDMKQELIEYVVFRFQKLPERTPDNEDIGSRRKIATWDKSLRQEVRGISQSQANEAIRHLNQTTLHVIDKKKKLGTVQQRQLDKAQEDLTARESQEGLNNYQWVLAQIDHQLRELPPLQPTACIHGGKPKKHAQLRSSSNSSSPRSGSSHGTVHSHCSHHGGSSHSCKPRKQFERLTLTAYFQREPRRGVDVRRLWEMKKFPQLFQNQWQQSQQLGGRPQQQFQQGSAGQANRAPQNAQRGPPLQNQQAKATQANQTQHRAPPRGKQARRNQHSSDSESDSDSDGWSSSSSDMSPNTSQSSSSDRGRPKRNKQRFQGRNPRRGIPAPPGLAGRIPNRMTAPGGHGIPVPPNLRPAPILQTTSALEAQRIMRDAYNKGRQDEIEDMHEHERRLEAIRAANRPHMIHDPRHAARLRRGSLDLEDMYHVRRRPVDVYHHRRRDDLDDDLSASFDGMSLYSGDDTEYRELQARRHRGSVMSDDIWQLDRPHRRVNDARGRHDVPHYIRTAGRRSPRPMLDRMFRTGGYY